ncbi:hypothetical protein QWZ08_03185 [Ferruginibacter paludis]|uniref:hypothetical protein n=1 Tax=Ferruginibacter paludis TaxID=1310417 RepID=UPI0025B5904C|nr:hypothetical protein [Ferruginibacter paludis]MDN3654614.1 hypothetical protein [Ferruginibacter paludis]
MKAISTILAVTCTFLVTSVNAQVKFTINNNPETVTNDISFKPMGAEGNELKFERDANGASIKWQAINESNTSHFELQLSYDNHTFETSKLIAASDVTAWSTNYEVKFRKTYLSEEKVYYRIKTVFNNGDEMYTASTTFSLTIGNETSYASIH